MTDWKEALERWERMVREGAYADAWEGELDSILGVRAHIDGLEAQLGSARETNRRLNRRVQVAEAAIPSYRKLVSMPPDGDGVRFVNGNMGRALLVWFCEKATADAEAAEARVRELEAHVADRESEIDVLKAERARAEARTDYTGLRGFGFNYYAETGRVRNWYIDPNGVKRWADDDSRVEAGKVNTYEEAHPLDRWTLPGGQTCWMTGEDCPECGHPLATDGRSQWCTAGCEEARK